MSYDQNEQFRQQQARQAEQQRQQDANRAQQQREFDARMAQAQREAERQRAYDNQQEQMRRQREESINQQRRDFLQREEQTRENNRQAFLKRQEDDNQRLREQGDRARVDSARQAERDRLAHIEQDNRNRANYDYSSVNVGTPDTARHLWSTGAARPSQSRSEHDFVNMRGGRSGAGRRLFVFCAVGGTLLFLYYQPRLQTLSTERPRTGASNPPPHEVKSPARSLPLQRDQAATPTHAPSPNHNGAITGLRDLRAGPQGASPGHAATKGASPAVPRNPVLPPAGVPNILQESEGQYAGVWTWNGHGYDVDYHNGIVATLDVKQFSRGVVAIARKDAATSRLAGLTALYTGRLSPAGTAVVNGSVTYIWPGHRGFPAAGSWSAHWDVPTTMAPLGVQGPSSP